MTGFTLLHETCQYIPAYVKVHVFLRSRYQFEGMIQGCLVHIWTTNRFISRYLHAPLNAMRIKDMIVLITLLIIIGSICDRLWTGERRAYHWIWNPEMTFPSSGSGLYVSSYDRTLLMNYNSKVHAVQTKPFKIGYCVASVAIVNLIYTFLQYTEKCSPEQISWWRIIALAWWPS